MIDAGYEIERLLQFALKSGLIGELDDVVCRNQLLELFRLEEPYCREVPEEEPEVPVEILERLMDYAGEAGLYQVGSLVHRELFDNRVMGLLMPRASELERKFWSLYRERGAPAATDYFYKFCKASNYIRTAQNARNLSWNASTEYGELGITINLTKPEKDPAQIARERTMPKKGYPKCLLCLENIGYAGRLDFPARQTHRVVSVNLTGERWYLQYSPYVYYNEHCIVLSEEHRPMKVDRGTFEKTLAFVEQFPHYTCGSNADLPIVGGSILSHDHFQGGCYEFPMEKASLVMEAVSGDFPEVNVSILKWPLSVIRASSTNISSLVDFSDHVLEAWRIYGDEQVGIFPSSYVGGESVPHNTITPIARKNQFGLYEMDLVLRNNRTSERFPDGIFHPHPEIHHVKKENIGLIEVMGLAILPGRLQRELEEIRRILTGEYKLEKMEETIKSQGDSHLLYKHLGWIRELAEVYGCNLSEGQAGEAIKLAVGEKFKTGLEHCGVFKMDSEGLEAFKRFLEAVGCVVYEKNEVNNG